MSDKKKLTRRNILSAGIATLAAGSSAASTSLASWKTPGETRVIFQWGDFYHNSITPEWAWRRVLTPTDWRLMFAQSIKFVTPEILSKTNLLVIQRYETWFHPVNMALEWVPDRIVEDRPTPTIYMTDEFEDALIENVRRGMGLVVQHCGLWNPSKAKYLKLIGVEKPYMHHPFQPAYLHKLNPNHPISAGIEPSDLGMDEIFYADLIPGQSEILFNYKGDVYETDLAGGWCREEGNGRVVVLLPGHFQSQYTNESYKKILWGAAHWAMKKDVPPPNHIKSGWL